MVDIHSHILPEIDDGSRDPQESLAMLQEMRRQGFDTVAATPHFYIREESAEGFLKRRTAALERLRAAAAAAEAALPEIRPGAEVFYFNGISHLAELPKLRIAGTKLLLLEMPNSVWSGHMLQELELLNRSGNLQILLAHVERCLPYQSRRVREELLEEGFLFQMNAAPFLGGFRTRHRAVKELKAGRVHFLGSDAHGLTQRKPELGKALTYIAKKAGQETIEILKDRADFWLGQD